MRSMTRWGMLIAVLLAALPAAATTYYVDGSSPTIAGGGSTAGTTQVDAGSVTTTIVLDATASATDDAYNNYGILLTSGAAAWKCRKFSDYEGATRTGTLASQFSATEANIEGVTYVIIRGADTNTGLVADPSTSTTGPFGTLQGAMAVATAAGSHTINVASATYQGGNGINYLQLSTTDNSVTFVGSAADRPILDTTSANRTLYMTGVGGGKHTFRNFIIRSSTATYTLESYSAQALRLVNTDLLNTSTTGTKYGAMFDATGSSARTFSMEGGTCQGYSYNARFYDDCGSIGFEGVTFVNSNTSEAYCVAIRNDHLGVYIKDPVLSCGKGVALYTDSAAGSTVLTSYCPSVQIFGATGTIGRMVTSIGNVRSLIIRDCDVTLLNDNAIYLGLETDGAPATTNATPFGTVVVEGNRFAFTDTVADHCVFLGVGTNNSKILGNRLITANTTSDGGVVVKSHYNLLKGNTTYFSGGYGGFYLAGGQGNSVIGNTIVATANAEAALLIRTNQDTVDAAYNIIRENILVGGLAFEIDSGGAAGADDWANVFEANVYYSTGSGANVANIGGTAVAQSGGAAALRTRWLAWVPDGYGGEYNDRSSIVADPKLANLTTQDFRVRWDSPAVALDAGAGAVMTRPAIYPMGPTWIR